MDIQRIGQIVKPTYYFLCFDQEILDEHTLALSCDEETWLYTIETSAFNGKFEHYQLGSPFHNQQIPTASGSVDSRTVTRRKHCSQRPTLDSVVESPLTNRSSLGLLGASQLLNDTLQVLFTPTPTQRNHRDKNFSRCTGSDSSDFKPIPERTLRLQSTNYGVSADNQGDSESDDVPMENCSPFEKQDVSCCPPKAFQDATDHSSLVLPENYEANNSLYICGSSEQLTDSLVNFLVPNCKPPSGFEDSCMLSSIVDVETCNVLPTSEMTDSVMDYLENVKSSSPAPLIESTTLSETENIPPDICDNQGLVNSNYSDCTGRLKASGDRNTEFGKVNSNFVSEKNEDGFSDERENITFTNNSNILREKKGCGDIEDDLNMRKHLKTNFELEFLNTKENNEKSLKGRALNNRDLNVTQELNSAEVNDFNLSKTLANEIIPHKFNAAVSNNNTKRNRTFTKSEIDEALNLYKQVPSRNSTFNTTFTRMNNSESNTNLNSTYVKTQDLSNDSMGVVEDKTNSTFTVVKHPNSTYDKPRDMSNSAVEDDKDSTTSSSSSCSTKPTSMDELRTIAQRQETNLARITSTPESSQRSSNVEATLNLEISPIRSPSAGAVRTNSESRSANCSPVRSQSSQIQPRCMHPSTKPLEMELRRQTLQASSLSNIARPMMSGMRVPQPVSRLGALQRPVGRPSTAPAPAPTTTAIPQVSGMRMPQPVSRLTAPQRPVVRPSTAPAPAPTTAIPRSRASRLPMPRLRGSGIPGYKRGGQ